VGRGKINSEVTAHKQNVYFPCILAVNGEILPGERFLEEKVPHEDIFLCFATASDSCASSLVSGAGTYNSNHLRANDTCKRSCGFKRSVKRAAL
jgi:hypothetical protein